jgi:hypothetical protein
VNADFLVFLQSVGATGAWVGGLLFLRFWRDSGDPLFAFFGGAFWLVSLSWTLLALTNPTDEARPYIYALRLVAFILIIMAMIVKNRESRGH